ncbi:MAG: radical SAM protein, partial [Bacteroidales bacterium]
VNLLPSRGKICSFDCIYCECGYNSERTEDRRMRGRKEVKLALKERLETMKNANERLDVITFAGNGEPTLNPEFEGIIDDAILLRNRYFPEVKISVLSNATRVFDESVFRGLCRVDNNILKLDSAIDGTLKTLNAPVSGDFTVVKQIDGLKRFDGNFILQTMFVRGLHNGVVVDNTTEDEIEAWIGVVKELKPRQVMIYTIARETPEKDLQKVSREDMERIADRVRGFGFKVSVSA